jgi:type II secretory pathway component GspD/PulD (secretin)
LGGDLPSSRTTVRFVVLLALIAAACVAVAQPRSSLETRITLEADDAHLPAVLAALAEKSEMNIVTGSGVSADDRISVRMRDVPILEAINLVVRAAGLSYEIVGNSILVADPKSLEEEVGLTSYVIDLQYATAREVKELLSDVTENVQVDTAGNRLLLYASPATNAQVRDIVAEVDVPSLQVMIDVRFIEVKTSDEKALGIDWSKLSSLTTIIAESPALTDSAAYLFTGGSRPPMYEDVSDDHVMVFQKISGFDHIGYFSRRLTAFDITLDWLVKDNKARVLANSQLTTMNNREASLDVVDEIWYQAEAGGVGGQITISSIEVGIKLKVTPQVNTDGFITVTITPEVSTIIGTRTGYLPPDSRKRTATTTLRVRDGQSIIIAGLLAEDEKKTMYSLPFLGDIPILGNLFRHQATDISETDLIVQITPHILHGGEVLTPSGEPLTGETMRDRIEAMHPDEADQ